MTEIVLVAFADALGQFLRPSNLLGVLVEGLAKSALFIMIAAGLTLIFGLLGVLNFAHGSLTMIGAYLGGLVMVMTVGDATAGFGRLGYFLVSLVAVFVALTLFGGAIERTLIRPLYDRSPLYQILLTFGLTLVLDEIVRIVVQFYGLQPISDWQAALGTKPTVLSRQHDITAAAVWGFSALDLVAMIVIGGTVWALLTRSRLEEPFHRRIESLPSIDTDEERSVLVATLAAAIVCGVVGGVLVRVIEFGAVTVRGLAPFQILFGLLTVVAVWGFLTRTRYGLIVRAGSEDPEMTEALAIDVRRVFTVVFALGTGLAGIAGVLLMWDPRWGASVPLAAETLLPAFVVVIIGGLGTFRGTVVAGIIVGMADAVTTWWFQNAIAFTGLPEMTVFLLLVVMLVLRPQGLFGVEGVGGH